MKKMGWGEGCDTKRCNKFSTLFLAIMSDTNKSFKDYVVTDLLTNIPDLSVRKMFSGYGLYRDGVMFGLITNSTLYLKTDEKSRYNFMLHKSRPFTYAHRDGKSTTLQFWEVPAVILEDHIALEKWTNTSFAVAQQEKLKKEAKKDKPKKGFMVIKEKFHKLPITEQDKLLLSIYRLSTETKAFLDNRLVGSIDGGRYLEEMKHETISKIFRISHPGTPSGRVVNEIISRAKKVGVDLVTMLKLEELAYRGFVEFLDEYGGGPDSFDDMSCGHLEAYLKLVKENISDEKQRKQIYAETAKYIIGKNNMITDYLEDVFSEIVGMSVGQASV